MKIKRIVLSSLLAAGCAISLAITAFAASEAEITKNQVTLSGYVAGVNWPWPMADKIYYNAAIWGQNVDILLPPTTSGGDNNKVYVQPSSDSKTLPKVYLWADQKRVSQSNKDDGDSCGNTAKEVKLYMWNQGSTDTITSALT